MGSILEVGLERFPADEDTFPADDDERFITDDDAFPADADEAEVRFGIVLEVIWVSSWR